MGDFSLCELGGAARGGAVVPGGVERERVICGCTLRSPLRSPLSLMLSELRLFASSLRTRSLEVTVDSSRQQQTADGQRARSLAGHADAGPQPQPQLLSTLPVPVRAAAAGLAERPALGSRIGGLRSCSDQPWPCEFLPQQGAGIQDRLRSSSVTWKTLTRAGI